MTEDPADKTDFPAPPSATERQESAGKVVEPFGLDDPFKPRQGRDLVWKDVNMTLAGKKGKTSRKLLDGVWGEVPRGQVTAIMGPSGSGKVCTMDISCRFAGYHTIVANALRKRPLY
jgi:ABC-type glutathione transport system ATPase component